MTAKKKAAEGTKRRQSKTASMEVIIPLHLTKNVYKISNNYSYTTKCSSTAHAETRGKGLLDEKKSLEAGFKLIQSGRQSEVCVEARSKVLEQRRQTIFGHMYKS